MPSPLPIRRIAITGSSGLCGRALVRAIRGRFPEAKTLGFDLNPPSSDPPDEFVQGSIVDADLNSILRRFAADTVVHLAYMVEPSRDRARMREVNITGTERILAAVVAAGVPRVVVSSSATVYGPWPEHAVPCTEEVPLRPPPRFTYAAHKGEVEAMLTTFAAARPEIAVAWTRPAIVCGRGEKNFLSDIFLTVPFMVLPGGRDTPLQFVHADDLADAMLAILAAVGRGPFNVSPSDALTQRDLAAMMGIAAVPMPTWLVSAAAGIWWTLRLPWVQTPPGLTDYLSHPWLIDSSRLVSDCDFSFRYSCREAFATLMPPHDTLSQDPLRSAKHPLP
jgi:nucleoside-diphosphate-sugar epimerase